LDWGRHQEQFEAAAVGFAGQVRTPLYFFHLEGSPKGELIADKRGLVLPDDHAALREAEAISAALKKR
jgi:hypothetical protein